MQGLDLDLINVLAYCKNVNFLVIYSSNAFIKHSCYCTVYFQWVLKEETLKFGSILSARSFDLMLSDTYGE